MIFFKKIFWLFGVYLFLMPIVSEAQIIADKRSLQTAFIYQFSNYINWPVATNTLTEKFIITIWKDSGLIQNFKELAKEKKIKKRPIVLNVIENLTQIKDSEICVLIDRDSAEPKLQENLNLDICLIITEKEGALDEGSMINFLTINGQLRFEINRTLMEKKGFKINSQLLRLSQSIK